MLKIKYQIYNELTNEIYIECYNNYIALNNVVALKHKHGENVKLRKVEVKNTFVSKGK